MTSARKAVALLGMGMSAALAVAACDAVLGLDSLQDRVDGGPPVADAGADAVGADAPGADAAVTATSCATSGAGLTDCGRDGGESCCVSAGVSGGPFLRSYDGVTNTDASNPATVTSFRLDRFEVTVGRFRKFVAAVVGGWVPAIGSGKHAHLNGGKGLVATAADGGAAAFEPGWDGAWTASLATTQAGWTTKLSCDASYQTWPPSPGRERAPINCVTWYEAFAFCIWDDGFLPSEAEWNYAAAGGGGSSGQRVYPWSIPPMSTAVDCAHANYGGGNFPTTACPPAGAMDVGATSPAGDGFFGQPDLTGNVWEWNLDSSKPYASPCLDCAESSASQTRVIRGGSFSDGTSGWRLAIRNNVEPATRGNDLGIRCARTP